MALNKVLLHGRLTRDPEERFGASGSSIVRDTLAVNRSYTAEGQPTADFFDLVLFGVTGQNFLKLLHKGSEVIIEGRLQTGSYEKEGIKIKSTDVIVEKFDFCGSKSEASASAPVKASEVIGGDGFVNIANDVQEELPFLMS